MMNNLIELNTPTYILSLDDTDIAEQLFDVSEQLFKDRYILIANVLVAKSDWDKIQNYYGKGDKFIKHGAIMTKGTISTCVFETNLGTIHLIGVIDD